MTQDGSLRVAEMKGIFLFLNKVYAKSPIFIFDLFSIFVAWVLAFELRFNGQAIIQKLTTTAAFYALALLVVVQVASYIYFKVYRGLWCFSSTNDVFRILKAVFVGTSVEIALLYFSFFSPVFPRSILPLYGLILVTLWCSGRLARRYFWDKRHYEKDLDDPQRVLVIGAGQAGEGLIRSLKRTQSYIPMGLVDESSKHNGLEVHGVRVLGALADLPHLVVTHQIDLIFIATPSANSATMRRIVDYCERCKVPYRTLPSLHALASGRVEVNALRKVNLDDLLGRDQVRLDWHKIAEGISGKRVLVTGGGGSIGSELCRQIMAHSPHALLVLDNSEFNLYSIDQALQRSYPHIKVEKSLLCVTDTVGINDVFNRFKPELVFHAAAFKHVPMMEDQVRSAVKNNVLGTQIVALASVAVAVEKFILISTDKAVNPTNVMGTTKRAAEIYCQNLDARVCTQFITVRFGNVLGSVGSVIPLFQQQLEHGGPLTVTHPEIQRYFMTIAEACQLILQAMVNGEGGEIFVLDMGEPIKITYLAEQMIRLAGKKPGKDIQIEYTGLRPGEKLFEELFHSSEQLTKTAHEKLFKARFRPIDWHELEQTFRLMQTACNNHQHDELLILLKSLVPEFYSLWHSEYEL